VGGRLIFSCKTLYTAGMFNYRHTLLINKCEGRNIRHPLFICNLHVYITELSGKQTPGNSVFCERGEGRGGERERERERERGLLPLPLEYTPLKTLDRFVT
jgi:hypothetical protein